MLREARIASLSASVGSSLEDTLAESMTHMSHRLTLTDLRSALLSGEPCNSSHYSQKLIFCDTNVKNRNLRQVLQCLPFSPDIFSVPHDHYVLQLVIVEVGGSERHHEVPEADH